jgi:hypothetical protein
MPPISSMAIDEHKKFFILHSCKLNIFQAKTPEIAE